MENYLLAQEQLQGMSQKVVSRDLYVYDNHGR